MDSRAFAPKMPSMVELASAVKFLPDTVPLFFTDLSNQTPAASMLRVW